MYASASKIILGTNRCATMPTYVCRSMAHAKQGLSEPTVEELWGHLPYITNRHLSPNSCAILRKHNMQYILRQHCLHGVKMGIHVVHTCRLCRAQACISRRGPLAHAPVPAPLPTPLLTPMNALIITGEHSVGKGGGHPLQALQNVTGIHRVIGFRCGLCGSG